MPAARSAVLLPACCEECGRVLDARVWSCMPVRARIRTRTSARPLPGTAGLLRGGRPVARRTFGGAAASLAVAVRERPQSSGHGCRPAARRAAQWPPRAPWSGCRLPARCGQPQTGVGQISDEDVLAAAARAAGLQRGGRPVACCALRGAAASPPGGWARMSARQRPRVAGLPRGDRPVAAARFVEGAPACSPVHGPALTARGRSHAVAACCVRSGRKSGRGAAGRARLDGLLHQGRPEVAARAIGLLAGLAGPARCGSGGPEGAAQAVELLAELGVPACIVMGGLEVDATAVQSLARLGALACCVRVASRSPRRPGGRWPSSARRRFA